MFKLLNQLLTLIMGIVEILLVFRFALKLLAANPASGFVAWIYETTQPLLRPFIFAFPTPSVKGGFTLEFTTLFALFAYAFLAYIIEEILEFIDKK